MLDISVPCTVLFVVLFVIGLIRAGRRPTKTADEDDGVTGDGPGGPWLR